jgi:hypothetical protein
VKVDVIAVREKRPAFIRGHEVDQEDIAKEERKRSVLLSHTNYPPHKFSFKGVKKKKQKKR